MRIIIADSRASIRLLIREVLTEEGHEIIAETDKGAEAITYYFDLRPDIIILDHHMDNMSGMDAVVEILQKDSWAHIILCTADPKSVEQRARRLGVKTIIPKPFSIHTLLESISI